MLGSDYGNQNCSIARTLELVGERWTFLVLRDVFLGVRRFDALQRDLGVARNVLSARLERLVARGRPDEDSLQRAPAALRVPPHRQGPGSVAGRSSSCCTGAIATPRPNGPPVVLRHNGCGGELGERRICTRCGEPLGARDVRAEPGPGAMRVEPEPGAVRESVTERA